MTTFVDSAAFYALLDEDDRNHVRAAEALRTTADTEILVSHNYVVVESAALVHRRLGADAVRVLFDALVPAVSVLYVDDDLHGRAISAYIAGLAERFSFVDRVSFEMMRQQHIRTAFTFDRDFARQGFDVVP